MPEELLLLAYDGVTGRRVAGSVELDCGLAGAVLAELAAAGRVGLVAGKVVVLDATPAGNEEADAVLARIVGQARQRKPDWWVEKLRNGMANRLLARLVGCGALRMELTSVLWLFSARRYFPLDPAAGAAARARLEWVLVHQGAPDPRTATLAALLDATGLTRRLFPGIGRRERKARMGEIGAGQWQAAAVRKAIQSIQSSD